MMRFGTKSFKGDTFSHLSLIFNECHAQVSLCGTKYSAFGVV